MKDERRQAEEICQSGPPGYLLLPYQIAEQMYVGASRSFRVGAVPEIRPVWGDLQILVGSGANGSCGPVSGLPETKEPGR